MEKHSVEVEPKLCKKLPTSSSLWTQMDGTTVGGRGLTRSRASHLLKASTERSGKNCAAGSMWK